MTTTSGKVQTFVRGAFCDVFAIGPSISQTTPVVAGGANFRALATAWRWNLDVEVDHLSIAVQAVRVVGAQPPAGMIEGVVTRFSSGVASADATVEGATGPIVVRITVPSLEQDPVGNARAANWIAALASAAGNGMRVRVPASAVDGGIANGDVLAVPKGEPALAGRALHDHDVDAVHFHSHDDRYANKGELASIRETVTALQSTVSNVQQQLAGLQGTLNNTNGQIASVDGRVGAVESTTNTLRLRRMAHVAPISWTGGLPAELTISDPNLASLQLLIGGANAAQWTANAGIRDVRLVHLALESAAQAPLLIDIGARYVNATPEAAWPMLVRTTAPAYGAIYNPGVAQTTNGFAVFVLNGV